MDDLIEFLSSLKTDAKNRQSDRQYKDTWSQYDYDCDKYDSYLIGKTSEWIREIEASRVKVDSSGVVEIDQHGVRSVNRG